jgi:hypothetical protein
MIVRKTEEFESEVERLNVTLVLDNYNLQIENQSTSSLLKDYEITLNQIMAKFRSFAFSTQEHHLALISHYDNLTPSFTSSATTIPTTPTPNLSHLASLIRKALRSLQGEDPQDEDSIGSPSINYYNHDNDYDNDNDDIEYEDDLLNQLTTTLNDNDYRAFLPTTTTTTAMTTTTTKRRATRDVSEGGYIGSSASTSPHHVPTSSSSSSSSSSSCPASSIPTLLTLPPSDDPPTTPPPPSTPPTLSTTTPPSNESIIPPPSLPPAPIIISSIGTNGPVELYSKRRIPIDLALERDIELETLRKENEQLRKMLNLI